jgi:4-hydroxybenzoate polyprenyltransferase
MTTSTATATADVAPAPRIQNPKSKIQNLKTFAGDIKIAHTVFALPFALLSTFLAAHTIHLPHGLPRPGQLGLILLCMVTARTVAMASNRLLDAELDARNPRTARRAIPSGALSRGYYRAALLSCAILFALSTAGFGVVYSNWVPLALCVPVLAFLACYPFLKRFTRLCHYYLGASLALAPVCAWIAVAGTLAVEPLLMAAAVMLWTAGFDIIYACQDFHSDRETGVISVPSLMGISRALWVSRATHLLCLAMLVALGVYSPALSSLYFVGVAFAAALLVVEHALVSPSDLSKVGLAFFTINGVISLLLGVLGILDIYL